MSEPVILRLKRRLHYARPISLGLCCFFSIVNRGGRGDRIGRYGNTHNDHNFRDMDYRGYGQEEEEAGPVYDVRAEGDRPYGRDDKSLAAPDFSPGRLQDRPGFHQRADGRGDMTQEGKGLPWAPCTQSQPDLTLPMLQRDEEGSKREFEQLRGGPQDRGRGKGGRGFPETGGSSAPPSGSREGNWGCGGGLSEQVDYNAVRQREEDRFSRGMMKRRVSRHNVCLLVVLLTFFFFCR